MSLLRTRMKKIQSEMKAPECRQHYILIFQTLKGKLLVVSAQIWLKFELIKACMHVLVSCKNGEVPIKSEGTRVVTTFLPLKVYGDSFQLLKGS